MISRISGEVIANDADQITIMVNGLGFDVSVPKMTAAETKVGNRVTLFTHLVVREDLLALYGFASIDERDFFLLLLGVEGIGPRIALGTLSVLSPDTIRRAVVSEQPEIFNRVSGIGKKTAQKILIHLQGRFKGSAEEGPISALDEINTQVLEALTSLGYSIIEAQTAIQALPADSPPIVEERLMMALQYFS